MKLLKVLIAGLMALSLQAWADDFEEELDPEAADGAQTEEVAPMPQPDIPDDGASTTPAPEAVPPVEATPEPTPPPSAPKQVKEKKHEHKAAKTAKKAKKAKKDKVAKAKKDSKQAKAKGKAKGKAKDKKKPKA